MLEFQIFFGSQIYTYLSTFLPLYVIFLTLFGNIIYELLDEIIKDFVFFPHWRIT